MGSVIHGSSHVAIKHFRDNPAALAVYWIYLARVNNEGVAWSSLRGLERDTNWNKDTCAKARNWLVEHGALEPVKDYIRPEWRKLDEEKRRQKINLDAIEYYRPTGVLTIGNVTYTMLYFGAQDAKPEEQETPDVRPDRTPTPSDADAFGRRPDRTELNTRSLLDSSTQLDTPKRKRSKKSESTQKDSLPNGKGASEQSVKPKRKTPAQPKHSKAELDAMYEAIADAWETDAGGWIGSMRKMFMGEATRGTWKECNFNPPATPDEITAFAEWWSYKKLSMPTEAVKIQKHFYDFRREKAKPKPPSHRIVTQEELESGAFQEVTPDDLPEAARAALDAWMEKMAG